MRLLYQLETEMEREIPVRLQASLQAGLDAYRVHCATATWRCTATTVPS